MIIPAKSCKDCQRDKSLSFEFLSKEQRYDFCQIDRDEGFTYTRTGGNAVNKGRHKDHYQRQNWQKVGRYQT